MANNLNSTHPKFQLFIYIILHDLHLICSFIISYPLYFSYFIFFCPYFIKFASLISPYFIATVFLSLLITFTFWPNLQHLELGILQIVIQQLRSNFCDNDRNYEDFEIYKFVFDRTMMITIFDDKHDDESPQEKKILEESVTYLPRNDVTNTDTDLADVKVQEELGLEYLFEEFDKFEDCRTIMEVNANFDKDIEDIQKEEKNVDSGSDVEFLVASENNKMRRNSGTLSSWRSNSSSTFSSYGSMREEKEWRKTLACKLFEERHNSLGGEEGMDSLWENYDNDNLKNHKNKTTINDCHIGAIGSFDDGDDDEHEDEDDDDDDEMEMSNGRLCCLQALKLSTGKMNLGMKKPNLVKITKVLKGFGWLHHVKKNKHGKKT